MANKHIRTITLQEPAPQFMRRAAEAMRRLGWEVLRAEDSFVEGNLGMTIWSWGEDISIRQVSQDQVEVASRSKLVTQIIDFGRNRKNVEKLLAAIDQV